MRLGRAVLDELRVHPGAPAALEQRSTHSTKADWLGDLGKPKRLAEEDLAEFVHELSLAQEEFWANGSRALLIVFQAMDAAGKDGTIRHVMSGVNPQGCDVTGFRQPSADELEHDFLWRCSKALPARGTIGIFNRSYYEDVLVVRVHPELLAGHEGGSGPPHESFWEHRYEDINAFERHLERNGTRVVKFYLHVSRDEQKQRLLDRLDEPAKYWKFSAADLAERPYWDDYLHAYEQAITATSTPWAPWYVVPADHKYALRALVGGVIVHTIDELDLAPPKLGPKQRAAFAEAKAELLAE